MENPNSPSTNLTNDFFEGFCNLYVPSQNEDDDHDNVDEEDDTRNSSITSPSPLPQNPNPYYLIFPPTTVPSPITPPWMTHVSVAGEFQQNLGDTQDSGALVECPEIAILRSLGLFGMMTCSKGPSLFPRLLDLCSEKVLFFIGIKVTSDPTTFLSLASNLAGSFTVRSLLRRSDTLDDLIFHAVCETFFGLMNSKHGHHVVIPTLRAVDTTKKEALYSLAVDYAMKLATQETGCLSLRKFLQEMRGYLRDRLLELVAVNAAWLAQDPYGNFVVQKVLTLENPSATSHIATRLKGSFASLSVQKFGSFVVEKCLNSPYGRTHVFEEFRESKDWIRVAKHEFGNFVAKRTLRILKEMGSPLYEEMVKKLKPHYVEMLRGHGRNTLRTIQTLEEEEQRAEANPSIKGSVGF